MDFFTAIKVVILKYTTFRGRAGRAEFWYWALFIGIVTNALRFLDMAMFPASVESLVLPLTSCFNVLVGLPCLAVNCRRLHDVGKSGWWQLLMLTIIGIIPLLWWWAKKGDPAPNRFDIVE